MMDEDADSGGDEQAGTSRPVAAGPYPGRLDERLLRPSAPLPPGAGIRVFPVAVDPFPGGSLPATWAPDPTGRHQWRWWGGVAWTEHVADDGIVDEDPIFPS